MNASVFRTHFPILLDSVHLASCSQGALSDRVIVAMSEFMTSWRVHAAPWQPWMEEVDRARAAFAHLIHADARDIAVVSCASEGAFQVAGDQIFTAGRSKIITNDLEFPSVAHVWLAAQAQGAHVRFIPHQHGMIESSRYMEALGADTALVSAPLVAYANGLRLPVAEIATHAHREGARVVVDAYQGVGVVPVDVNQLGCDYLIAGALKYLLGSPGMAFLWVRPGLSHPREPELTGWFGRSNPFAFTPQVLDFAEDARRFQTGTPAIGAAYAAAAGLSLINETDTTDVFSYISTLADHLQAAVVQAGYTLYSPPDPAHRGPQVAVLAKDGEHLSAFLQNRRIFASPRGKALRMSLHYYNNMQDIEQVTEALLQYRDENPLML